MAVMRASRAAWAWAPRTFFASEMNEAGVGTGGTYLAIAPPRGVVCGRPRASTRSGERRIISGKNDDTTRNVSVTAPRRDDSVLCRNAPAVMILRVSWIGASVTMDAMGAWMQSVEGSA